jgi:predicted ATPase/DNA-binding SARP family transcriptional activator
MGKWMWGMSFKIYLLGQFKLQANDLPIELPSRPAQSLLAYLVLNAGVTQRREKLASLLWPEATETNARSYLRQALWRLRKTLESGSLSWEDYLNISDISVTFDKLADYWLDTEYLLETAAAQPVEEMIENVRLYRGELLPGFYDEWIVLERDRLQAAYHQQMNRLLECFLQNGEWDKALKWSEQWIRLGYSPEPAFRALMRAYAGLGDQGMVSATYQRCMDSLDRELGLGPSPETKQLHNKILSGELNKLVPQPIHSPDLIVQRPSFLDEGEPRLVEKPIFFAREAELAQLGGFLDQAIADQGKVIFVTGETGSGKTALVNEFTQRSQDTYTDLVVTSGNCNAHTGIGDPYLPFREILGQLTGDVEARYAAGSMTRQHAHHLWGTLPLVAQTLVETGPDLIDSFVPGSALVERAEISATGQKEWLTRLVELADRKETGMIVPSPQQNDLFEQYARVLQTVARQVLLVLVVDDLQWADLGSISLLFHLGRHLAGSRILIVGAFRPEEVALGRDGDRHPLEPVVNELRREYGDITVNVDQAERRTFVELLLDSEPNQLGHSFREMFYQQTHGHPLFSIELLRGMQERGDLVKDQGGQWIEGAALDWETLPARVEAVVAERISRLAQPLQSVLRVASVEGETFTAEVVARVTGIDKREMLAHLSAELDKKHRLIRAQSIQRLEGQLVSRYRFRHIISQKYLYGSLDPVERVHLHEQVAITLEELYGAHEVADTTAIAPQLARHFQEARIEQKAIHYLHQAGRRAVHLSAIQEATTLLNRALALLMDLPYSSERDQQELALQLTLGMAWISSSSPRQETKNAYTRARQLCQQTGETTQLCQILIGLSVYHYVRAEHQRAIELGEEALIIARDADDTLLMWLGHWSLGFNLFALGEYTQARDHLAEITSSYKHQQHHQPLVMLHASDPGLGALAYESCCLWCLGYPDQALRSNQKALDLAREFDHSFSLADVLCYAGCMFNAMSREANELYKNVDEMMRLSIELNYRGWLARATSYLGSAQVKLGQVQEGIKNIKAGIADNMDDDAWLHMSGHHCFLGEAYGGLGQPGKGLQSLNEALEWVEKTDEHHWEAEAYRLRGELQLMEGDQIEAETSIRTAIEIARGQHARSWELRATMSLARLWRKQGRTNDARQVLAEIYNWFTEGFDTPDLREAKSLLEKLSNNP